MKDGSSSRSDDLTRSLALGIFAPPDSKFTYGRRMPDMAIRSCIQLFEIVAGGSAWLVVYIDRFVQEDV